MNKYNYELSLEDRNPLSLLISRIKQNSTILEFGPANGRMTKYLKEELNCKVYAVEIDEEAANDAKKYTEKIIIDSIENYTWQEEFKDIKFDFIIFADVLEHLYYPEKVLKSINNYLKEEGSVLISIPNISHNSITMGLLKNEFNYSPTGLLDDTHIRFFTQKTFDNLIKKCAYFKSYETASFIAPNNTEFGYRYEDFPKYIAEYLSEISWGEAYQLIYELKKYETEIISDFEENYRKDDSKFVQLFIETGNDSNEEISIKKDFQNELYIEFDLSKYTTINCLKLNPLNDSCVIEIEKISFVLYDGKELDLKPYILTNACVQHGNFLFFNSFKPWIKFQNIDFTNLSISKFILELKYNHISNDAVQICLKQIITDRDYILEVKEKDIENLGKDLKDKENDIENLNKDIENLNKDLKDKENDIENLSKNLEEKEIKNQNLTEELINIYSSKSWKLTRPLRKIVRKIKNLNR